MSAAIEERFWRSVQKTDGCWLWLAGKTANGYGQIHDGGKKRYAHRLSMEISGTHVAGLDVDHLCHNRSCVRPSHLRAVTHAQNLQNHSGPQANSTSGVRGVTWHRGAKKWTAKAQYLGVTYHAGLFENLKDAEAAVIALRNEIHTHNGADRMTKAAKTMCELRIASWANGVTV